MTIIVIVIVIVIVKEPSLGAVIIAKSIEIFTCQVFCMQVKRRVCRTDKKKKNKQSLAITKKPCISSIFPPDLDKSLI